MYFKYFSAFIILSSCSMSYAAPTNAFSVVQGAYRTSGATVEVPNMPRVKSQDSLGVCFGFSGATVAQHYICRQKKIANCAAVPSNQEISPLSMTAWANTNNPNGGVPETRNHSNIRMGGLTFIALDKAQHQFIFEADSCFPFDQFANRYGTDVAATNAMLKRIEAIYERYKGSTEGTYCVECINEALRKDLDVSRTARELGWAINNATFGEFLHTVVFGDCPDIVRHRPKPKAGYYPQLTDKPELSVFMSKTKELLAKGLPVALDGVCLEMTNGKCQTRHSVVIAGYRKMCKTPNDCREVFKVHNSWGQDWQNRHDGGWVDANLLLQGVPGNGAISWYE